MATHRRMSLGDWLDNGTAVDWGVWFNHRWLIALYDSRFTLWDRRSGTHIGDIGLSEGEVRAILREQGVTLDIEGEDYWAAY